MLIKLNNVATRNMALSTLLIFIYKKGFYLYDYFFNRFSSANQSFSVEE